MERQQGEGEMARQRRQREMVKPLLISSHVISHSRLLCQDRLFDSIIPALLSHARPQPMALCWTVSYVINARLKKSIFQKESIHQISFHIKIQEMYQKKTVLPWYTKWNPLAVSVPFAVNLSVILFPELKGSVSPKLQNQRSNLSILFDGVPTWPS